MHFPTLPALPALLLLLTATTATAALARPTHTPTPLPPAPTCPIPQCTLDTTSTSTAAACDVSTSCLVTVPSGQQHCACRAGYKAAAADDDASTHYRTYFPGQEFRVFVRPGVVCDTLCEEWMLGSGACTEVGQVEGCN